MTNAPPEAGSSSKRARQGLDQIAPRQPVHRAEQIADGVALALVDDRERLTPRLGQPQIARAGIITSPYACDPAACREPRDQAAQIPRVHVERVLQHGCGDGFARRDLEQQPRFWQGRLGAEELAVERADRLGVQAVEPADRGDVCIFHVRHAGSEWLTESSIAMGATAWGCYGIAVPSGEDTLALGR